MFRFAPGAAMLLLSLLLGSCPSGSSPDALPPCNPTHGNADCHGTLHYCMPLGGVGEGRCVACRRSSDCDDGVYCNGSEQCDAFLGCMHGTPIDCGSCRACDEGMRMCVDALRDDDGDGHHSVLCGGDDCDDADPGRYPGNHEVCDSRGYDEDCDPATLGPDDDGDGFPSDACCNRQYDGTILCGGDCDDTRATVSPTAVESCNGIDDDCDGMIDEDVVGTVYVDADGDGWGAGPAQHMCTGETGYAFQAGDCDDGNAQLHPGAFRCGGSGSAIDVCGDDGKWSELSCPGDGMCVAQPDGTGVCWPGTQAECADGTDNDGDGLVDTDDPDCTSPTDTSEHPQRCGDGIDNDGDHLTDYPNDPGCTSREDDDEADPATLPACANGKDDDGDGQSDYAMGTGDPGCTSASDDSERNPNGPQCDNGLDDDGDTHIDFPDDPQCSGPLDNNEDTPACSNGIDDDGDGLKDYVQASNMNDPGCTDANDDSERGVPPNAPTCDNGIDDDGDGATDYPDDRGCTGPADMTE